MPVYTFLEQYDLRGKTIIPFCTAYSGPSSTLKDIVKATPESDHRFRHLHRDQGDGRKGHGLEARKD